MQLMHNLKFKLRGGPVSPGCAYVLVVWMTGKSKTRRLVSCHRTLRAARTAREAFTSRRMWKAQKTKDSVKGRLGGRVAIYNINTGGRLK